jgi:hypothetical protein
VLMRREACRRAGRFDPDAGYALDLDMWTRFLEMGDVCVIPDALVRYRVSAGSWSVATESRQASDTVGVLDRIPARSGGAVGRDDLHVAKVGARANQFLRRVYYALSRVVARIARQSSGGAGHLEG